MLEISQETPAKIIIDFNTGFNTKFSPPAQEKQLIEDKESHIGNFHKFPIQILFFFFFTHTFYSLTFHCRCFWRFYKNIFCVWDIA